MKKERYLIVERTNPYRLGKVKCKLLEIKRASKNKDNASIKITIPDDLASKLLDDEMNLIQTVCGKLIITGLILKWEEDEKT